MGRNCFFWTLGFDTVYAIPDREFDRRLGINSSALFFLASDRLKLWVSFLPARQLCSFG